MTSLLRMPPGVKPTYPVEINWDHPLAKGLAFVLWDNVNLVDRTTGAVGSDAVIGYGPYGSYYDGTGVDRYVDWVYGAGKCPLVTDTGDGTGDFTLLSIAAPVSASTKYGLVSQSKASNDQCFLLANTAGNFASSPGSVQFSVSPGSGNANATVAGAADGEWHIYTGRRFGGTLGLFVDGGVETTGSTGNSTNVHTDAQGVTTGGLYGYSGWDARDPVGMGVGWNRALSTNEIQSLSRDPYQFLKPAASALNHPALAITTPTTYDDGLRVPDPKWEAPSILVPGTKPMGPVEIDRDHPLATDLSVCYFSDSTSRFLTNSHDTPVNTETTDAGVFLTTQGPAEIRDGSDYYSFSKSVPSGEWTLFFSGAPTEAWASSGMKVFGFCEEPGSSVFDRQIIGGTSWYVYLYDVAGKSATATTVPAVGRTDTIVGRCTSDTLYIYVNGVQEDSVAISNTGYGSYGSPEFNIGNSGNVVVPGCAIHICGLSERAWTHDECIRWTLDPYQLLIPA